MNIRLIAIGITLIALVNSDFCPGKKIRCQKHQTCCSDTKGSYGCCPYENGTCCSDLSHCCPAGTECDIPHERCVQKRSQVEWQNIVVLEAEEDNQSNEIILNATSVENQKKKCPDGDQSCPDSYTCCNLTTGGYGCCPFKEAKCCPDRVHCCPSAQKCDATSNSCI